jgi:hypothetical protein
MAMGVREEMLKKIASAKATAGGNRIKDGNYLFEIMNILVEKKFSGWMFIAEFLVREATASGLKDATGRLIEPNAVGSTCGYVLNLDKNISAVGNAKAMILALFGMQESEVSDEDFFASLDAVSKPDQPARGMLIAASTFHKAKRNGDDFMGLNFTGVDNPEDQVAARRAAQEKAAKAA